MTPYEKQTPISRLLRYFRYDAESGNLYWKIFGRQRIPNKPVGSIVFGYRRTLLLNRPLRVHRIVWAMHTGKWPKQSIDHINGIRGDNRIENLREASPKEQSRNRAPKRGQPYPKGVYKHKDGPFHTTITFDGKRHSMGFHPTPEQAAEAYNTAAKKLFGQFAYALDRGSNVR